jgi:hypothetical protein
MPAKGRLLDERCIKFPFAVCRFVSICLQKAGYSTSGRIEASALSAHLDTAFSLLDERCIKFPLAECRFVSICLLKAGYSTSGRIEAILT